MKYFFVFSFLFLLFAFSCGGIQENNKKTVTADKYSITISPDSITDTSHFYDKNKNVCVPLNVSISKNNKLVKDFINVYYLNPEFISVYDEENNYITSGKSLLVDKIRVLKLCYYLNYNDPYKTSVVFKYKDAVANTGITVNNEDVNFRLTSEPQSITLTVNNSIVDTYILLSLYANNTPISNHKIYAHSFSDSISLDSSFTTDQNGLALVPLKIDTSKKLNTSIMFYPDSYNVKTLVPVIIQESHITYNTSIYPTSLDVFFDPDSDIKYKDLNFFVSVTDPDSNPTIATVNFSFSNSSLGMCFNNGTLTNYFTAEVDKYYNLTCRVFAPEVPLTTTAFVIANSSISTINIKSEPFAENDISLFFAPDNYTYYTKQEQDSSLNLTASIFVYNNKNKPVKHENIFLFYTPDDYFSLYPHSVYDYSYPLQLTTDDEGKALFDIVFLAKSDFQYSKLITAVCRNKTATFRFEVKQ